MNAKGAGLTRDEIRAGRERIERAVKPRALPVYSAAERETLAILQADLARRQSAKGKARRAPDVAKVARRRQHVNLLFRYVIGERYRKNPKSLATIMKIVDWLYAIGIEASEPQVRRDLGAILKSEPCRLRRMP